MAIKGVGGGGTIGPGGFGESQHTVKQGDTMEQIARQYGVSTEALLKNNPSIKDPAKLQAGMLLNIPTSQPKSSSPKGSESKDTFEAVRKDDVLDQLTSRGQSRETKVAAGEGQAFKAAPGEAKAFNFGSGEAKAFNFGAGEARVSKPISTEISEMKPVTGRTVQLSPDQFEINDQGHLIIKNPEISQHFKSILDTTKESNETRALNFTLPNPEPVKKKE